jgi:hypothetical protein
MVSDLLWALIGADFSFAAHNRRLFYGFGPFTALLEMLLP